MIFGATRQRKSHGPAPFKQVPRSLVAEYFKRYVWWREQADAVEAAYDHWLAVEAQDKSLAFAAYESALDREEHAARALRASVDRVAATVQSS